MILANGSTRMTGRVRSDVSVQETETSLVVGNAQIEGAGDVKRLHFRREGEMEVVIAPLALEFRRHFVISGTRTAPALGQHHLFDDIHRRIDAFIGFVTIKMRHVPRPQIPYML